jgi:predicted nucleotidyltransferase
MNLSELRETGYIIGETIVGSQLYGLATPESDTDTKGIFKLPIDELLKFSHPQQIDDERNDTVFYELKRFLDLAMAGNPNILEVLYAPDDKILIDSIDYQFLRENRSTFLTKNIRNSLGGYAVQQIKKARGQKKKIVNPVDKKRKDLLDFTYVLAPLGATPIKEWLHRQRHHAETLQENYGAASVDHAKNVFYIYYNKGKYDFKGLIGEDSNQLRMSSIPKDVILDYIPVYCNIEGYSTYCKEYKEYWDWVAKRNPARYASVEKHGKGYDGKNLMHCFRLLEMGIDAARTGELQVVRPNREWLLKVRAGDFEYDDLINEAERKLKELDEAIEKSSLPSRVNRKEVEKILMSLRHKV